MIRVLILLLCILFNTSLSALSAENESGPDHSYDRVLKVLAESGSRLKRFELENGMICLVKEDHSAPVVSVQVWVGTGSIHEEEYLGAGMSHAVEHMLFKGTEKRRTGDFWKDIEEAGGRANAYTTDDRTVYFTDIPSSEWKVGLDVISDAVMNSTFPEEEWKKEKNVILREFAMGKDDPHRVIGKLMSSTVYRVHPYRYPTIGYESIFRNNTRDDLLKFYRRHYVPDNMMTVVVGDVDAADAKKTIENIFSGFERRRRKPVILPREPGQAAPRFARKTGPYNVSRTMIAYHTVAISDPDSVALDVLAEITGHGQSCRLVKNIREEKKLATSIRAGSWNSGDSGIFVISATFEPDKEDALLEAIEEEVNSWSTAVFPEEETAKARRKSLIYELSDLETIKGQADSYAFGEFFVGDPRFAETYIKQLQKVTPAELKRVAARYFRPQNRTTVILSPDKAEEKTMESAEKASKPETRKAELKNGVPIVTCPDRKLPFVYISVVFNGGLLSETRANNGVTSMMATLLKRGTKTRGYDDIAVQVESLGASLNTFSGNNTFGITARCLSTDADRVMSILSDCLVNSTFPEDEIEKQKTFQAAAIDKQMEQPMFLAQLQLKEALFKGHPYSMNTSGTKESVEGMTRKDIVDHYRRLVVTGNMSVSIFGDISASEAEALAARHLAAVPEKKRPKFERQEQKPRLGTEIIKENDQKQAILTVGFPGVDINDPRKDALTLLSESMSGLGSNLGVEVREKRGLVYFIGSRHLPAVDPGSFIIYAGTRRDAVDELKKLIRAELDRVSKEGITKEELEKEKKKAIAEYEMQSQDTGEMATGAAINELLGLGYDYNLKTRERYEAVTLKDIRKAAKALLSPDREIISIVLPEKEE